MVLGETGERGTAAVVGCGRRPAVGHHWRQAVVEVSAFLGFPVGLGFGLPGGGRDKADNHGGKGRNNMLWVVADSGERRVEAGG